MSDLSDAQRAARGQRAAAAMEFLRPAFDAVRQGYTERCMELAAGEIDPARRIEKLAIAYKIAIEVEKQIAAVVTDGEMASRDLAHRRKIEEIRPYRRRVLGI